MASALTDTSADIAAAQRQRLAAMSVGERADALIGLCEAVTQMTIAGIRHTHPGASDAEVRSHLLLRRYGPEFVASLPPEIR